MRGLFYVNRSVVRAIVAAIVLTSVPLFARGAHAAQDFASYLPKVAPADFFPEPIASGRRRAIPRSCPPTAAISCRASST